MENTCDLLITNAKVVVPKAGLFETNILIEGSRIKAIQQSVDTVQASRKINAQGKYVLPGIIDPHVHYGVYTPIEVAAKSESRSAAIGGVTTMMRMLRLYGSYHDIKKHIDAGQSSHFVDYSIHSSILKRNQLEDIKYLKQKCGLGSVKIYANLDKEVNHILMDLDPNTHDLLERHVNIGDQLISDIIQEASMQGSIVLIHAEDPEVCSRLEKKNKNLHEPSKILTRGLKIWSRCRPASSEARVICKTGTIARKFRSTLYFVHIGSRIALDSILRQREKGNSTIYVETCPHYLTHTYDFPHLTGKVVPPLRTKKDIQSLWSGLANGVIDTIGSDHVANRLSIKQGQGDLWSTKAGFPGIATLLPVILSKGVNEGRISLERVAEVVSYNAARIFGLYPRKGTIEKRADADLVIVDLNLAKKVTPEVLQSYSDYSIYDGWKLQGWPIYTIVRGRVIMENGQVDENACGHGRIVHDNG
jgi:dihydropyrimidinase